MRGALWSLVSAGEGSGAWGDDNGPRVIQWWSAGLRARQSGSRVPVCHHDAVLFLDGFFHRKHLRICWMELGPECLSVISPRENGCSLSLRYSLSSCVPTSSLKVILLGLFPPRPLPLCISLLLSCSAEKL